MSSQEIRLGILRSGGERDWFTLATGDSTTLLEVLDEVRLHQDSSLVYRHSCHHGSCGTCGVMANGQPVLACTTRIRTLEGPVHVDPLPGFPVIADLAVDTSSLLGSFPSNSSYLRASTDAPGTTEPPIPPPETGAFTRFENCIECGLCEVACPVTVDFVGPAALAAFNREIARRPDRTGEILDHIAGSNGVSACEQAFECSRVCPAGVFPGRHISELRDWIATKADSV